MEAAEKSRSRKQEEKSKLSKAPFYTLKIGSHVCRMGKQTAGSMQSKARPVSAVVGAPLLGTGLLNGSSAKGRRNGSDIS